MERKNKACWNCCFYKAYYVQDICHFNKQGIGLCTKNNKTVDKHEQCDYWHNAVIRRAVKRMVTGAKIEEMANTLKEIKQILSEDERENRE